jgi:ribosomal protein S18 acetylase RimI-like enzyme
LAAPPGVLNLYRHLNPDEPAPDPVRAATVWSALLMSKAATVIVAELDDMLVSSCVLIVTPNLTRGARPFAVIENVVTHADYRRRGFGRSVLDAALSTAWEAGCYKVMLATGSKSEATLRFYERVGFERGGKTFFQARRL